MLIKRFWILVLIISWTTTANGQVYSWWQENSNTFSRCRNINFADNNTGWAFGDSSDVNGFVTGIILKTTDQGLNWAMTLTPSPNIRIYSSHFSSLTNGIAVGRFQPGGGVSMYTMDGGVTWQVDSVSFPERLYDVAFGDVNNGWICGRNGYGARSNDGGITWTTQTTNTAEHLYSVAFCDTSTGWMVGADPGTGGTIIKTIDGGINWVVQNNTAPNDLMAVYAFSPAKAVAVGFAGTIVLTTDSGNTWQQVTSGTPQDLLAVDFTDSLHGWAGGTAGVLLVTTDGGFTWSPDTSNTTNPINSICMKDTTLGWFCGDNGDIYFYGYSPVTVDETVIGTQLEIYPNPTEGICYLPGEVNQSAYTVTVYDILGNKLQESIISNGEPGMIDMSTFLPGVYMIAVDLPEGKSSVTRVIRK